MAITDAQQARQMYYRGGSPADDHNQPGWSDPTPSGGDYEDDNAIMMESMGLTTPSGPDRDDDDKALSYVNWNKPTQGPSFINRFSDGASNVFDRISGGIGNVANYYGNSANQKGILGTLLGSIFLGPLGGILGGMYGRGMFKNPFTVQTDESITQDSNLIDQRFMGSMGVTPQILPQKKPIQLGTPPYTNIEPLMAKQLTIPFDYSNLGDPYKDNYYDQNGNYIGPTVTG